MLTPSLSLFHSRTIVLLDWLLKREGEREETVAQNILLKQKDKISFKLINVFPFSLFCD